MADADLLIKVGTQPKDPFEDVKDSLDDVEEKSEGVTAGFGKIAGAIGALGALAGTFDFILDATMQAEDLTRQFVRFTGSVDSAAAQLEELRGIEGPSLPELAEANRTLFAFGVSAKNSIDQMKQLADIAQGSGAGINELAEIFGKIQFEGNLTAETFSKLQKQVPGLAKDIANSLDIPEASLKSLAATGEITSREVLIALEKMTSEGGRYFGAADSSTKDLSGSFGELQEAVTNLAAEIGGRLTPSMASSTNVFTGWIEKITDYLKSQKEIASDPTLRRIEELNTQIESATTVLNNLNSIKQGEGIAALGKFLYGGEGGVDKYMDKVTASLVALTNEKRKLNEQLDQAATDKALEENAREIEEQQRKQNDKTLELEREKNAKLKEEREKAEEERRKKVLDAEKQIGDLRTAEQAVQLQRETLLIQQDQERKAELQKAAAAQALEAEQVKLQGISALRTNAEIADETRELETNERRRVANLEALNAREAELTAARATAEATRQELLGQFEQAELIRAQDNQRKLTETQKKAEADRLAAIRKAQKDQFDIALQTSQAQKQWDEQTYAQRLATAQTGLNALAGLMKSKNREAFEIGKAAAIAQALVAIPATAIDAYKSLAGVPLVGPALGAAAAAAAVVAGMEQVRAIQSQRLALAEGGIVPGVGNKDTVPALLTPGEVVVPKNNFNDLQDAFVRGAVADDQVMLLQAGNNIQMRILDTLTYGSVSEKLSTMISQLDRVRDAISNINLQSPEKVEEVKEAQEEIVRNQPVIRSREIDNSNRESKKRVESVV